MVIPDPLPLLDSADYETSTIGLQHVDQMQRFITASQSALRTITKIALEIHQEMSNSAGDGSRVDVSAVVGPLAGCCSKLQQLRVEGDVGSTLFAAFGSSCSKLTSVATQDVPVATLEKLPKLLPCVTSSRMLLYAIEDLGESMGPVRLFRNAISSSSTLISLDISGQFLMPEDWLALPSCLQELQCQRLADAECQNVGPPAGLVLPNLKKVVVEYSDSPVPLSLVADLLRAAPLLLDLQAPCLEVQCDVEQIPDLVCINAFLAAGFKFTGGEGEHCEEGAQLIFTQHASVTGLAQSTLMFAASLPILAHFKSLDIRNTNHSLLTDYARAFPGATQLGFSTYVDSSVFPSLRAFSSVKILSFSILYGAEFTSSELVSLCRQMPSVLFLEGFRMSLSDEKSFMATVSTWNRRIRVEHY